MCGLEVEVVGEVVCVIGVEYYGFDDMVGDGLL